MAELEDDIYDQITDLSAVGEDHFENGDFKTAITYYQKALELVPLPKTNWEASTWLYTAIGDCYFSLSDFEKASDAFYDALNCPDGMGNPFIHLRLGECLFEGGEFQKAEDNLMRAYMLEGIEIFEDEDDKYIRFLKKKYTL